jgi:hypothetical protein
MYQGEMITGVDHKGSVEDISPLTEYKHSFLGISGK